MKYLITVLAFTAILATPATAKTHKVNHHVQHVAVLHNTTVQAFSRGISLHCRFDRGETDPDPRIRFQLVRDCRDWDYDE